MSKIKKELSKDTYGYYQDYYLDIYKRCQKADDLKGILCDKNSLIALIMMLSLTIAAYFALFLLNYPNNSNYLINSIIFSIFLYGSICVLLWYIHSIAIYFNWKKTKQCINQTLFIKGLRYILSLIMILPMFIMISIWMFFVRITKVEHLSRYATESFLSMFFALIVAVSIWYLSLMFILYNSPLITIISSKMPPTTTLEEYNREMSSAIISYSSLLGWIIYKLFRNTFLFHLIIDSSSSKELGHDGCKAVQKRIRYDLDTIGLILILIFTILLTPLRFYNETLEIMSKALQYLCITSSALIALIGHIK